MKIENKDGILRMRSSAPRISNDHWVINVKPDHEMSWSTSTDMSKPKRYIDKTNGLIIGCSTLKCTNAANEYTRDQADIIWVCNDHKKERIIPW
jgi:hypothetical protein